MAHVAIDIGASSGRLVLGELLKNNQLTIKEIFRFENGYVNNEGTLCWDIDRILHEILKGLEAVKAAGYDQCTVGIDTWAVDYVLLGKDGNRLKEVVSYRDHRTDHTLSKVMQHFTKEQIYEKTGIQFLPFNTFYQLFEEDLSVIQQTDKIIMVPDYLNYRLTGKAVMEKTNASTTQLLNIETRLFDPELLDLIGIRKEQFAELISPGKKLGELKKEWFPEFNLPDCTIITVASHDTASAVAGTPGTGSDWAYLSSGTWSLLGMEVSAPVINEEALKLNYTNEWGAFDTFRFLKNITGMWIVQEMRKQLPKTFSYSDLVLKAQKMKTFQQFINFNEDRFLNPANMITEIQNYCKETNQPIPKSVGELACCIYSNLAVIYAIALKELENITNKQINRLHIVGGGTHNKLLNQMTADLSSKTVYAGPTEATAIGNILIQMISTGVISNLEQGREIVRRSFQTKPFIPKSGYESGSIIECFLSATSKRKEVM